jgi:hypothetical protein
VSRLVSPCASSLIVSEYPTTPSRVQLSLWPGGSDDYAAGTIEWAGGSIDWANEEYLQAGYYWFTLQSVNIQCAAVPTNATESGDAITGWVYTGNSSDGTPVGLQPARKLSAKRHRM